jgi:hypothetical protein
MIIRILSLLVRLTAISLGGMAIWVGIEGNPVYSLGIIGDIGSFLAGIMFLHYGFFKKEIITR